MPKLTLHLTNDQLDSIRKASDRYKSPSVAAFVAGSALSVAEKRQVQFELYEYDPLTSRETELLKLIAIGKSTEEISLLLDISKRTTLVHIYNINKKLKLHRRTDLMLYALRKGIAQLPKDEASAERKLDMSREYLHPEMAKAQ